MERCAAADCFTVVNAKIFGYVNEYLSKLTGNEEKRNVAKKVAKIVRNTAPQYLIGATRSDIKFTDETFQTLVDDLQE